MLHDWYYHKNVFTKSECKDILSIAQNNSSNLYNDHYDKTNGKNVKVNVVETKKFGNKLDLFFNLVTGTNEEIFGFNLFNRLPLTVNLNTYLVGQEYPFHRDASINASMADIKLTAILNLSQKEFTGGEFEIYTGKENKIEEINTLGSVLIFPSFLCHRVKPILSGTRISLSCWFSGPNWK